MFIVMLVGGLGNQISNYAFARLLKHCHPEADVRLYAENYRFFPEHNGYEIPAAFELPEGCAVLAGKRDYVRVARRIPCFSNLFRWKFCRGVLKGINFFPAFYYQMMGKDPFVYEAMRTESEVLKNITQYRSAENCLFFGLWLNSDYAEIMSQLREELKFREIHNAANDVLVQKIAECDETSVAFHVRRCDRVGSALEVVCVDYYLRAVAQMNERVVDPRYFVFSDDPAFAGALAEKLRLNYSVVDINHGTDSYMDMCLMSKCRHFIMPNSSFSYWAALLGRQNDSVVICPAWHTPAVRMWTVPGFTLIDNGPHDGADS